MNISKLSRVRIHIPVKHHTHYITKTKVRTVHIGVRGKQIDFTNPLAINGSTYYIIRCQSKNQRDQNHTGTTTTTMMTSGRILANVRDTTRNIQCSFSNINRIDTKV